MYKLFSLTFFIHTTASVILVIFLSDSLFERNLIWMIFLAGLVTYISFGVYIVFDTFFTLRKGSYLSRGVKYLESKFEFLKGKATSLKAVVAFCIVGFLATIILVSGMTFVFGVGANIFTDYFESKCDKAVVVESCENYESSQVRDLRKRMFEDRKQVFLKENESVYMHELPGYTISIAREHIRESDHGFDNIFYYGLTVSRMNDLGFKDYTRPLGVHKSDSETKYYSDAINFYNDEVITGFYAYAYEVGDAKLPVFLLTIETENKSDDFIIYPTDAGDFNSYVFTSDGELSRSEYFSIQYFLKDIGDDGISFRNVQDFYDPVHEDANYEMTIEVSPVGKIISTYKAS